MDFADMTASERAAYKKALIGDFTDRGMSEREALACYVFCVNPDPVRWLGHKYGIPPGEAESLRESGMAKYAEAGGTADLRRAPSAPPRAKRQCRCSRLIVPE
ncbi:MAG: hypothetical protein LBG62_00155 [Candidatus Methanoplasma sp.]|jgi:hypothetical protein|nr:hypothetical protein [Candidatus Methanoplasma sp.]